MPDDPDRWFWMDGPVDLQAEAEVTPEDKARAPRFWAKYATPLLKRLLNAGRAE